MNARFSSPPGEGKAPDVRRQDQRHRRHGGVDGDLRHHRASGVVGELRVAAPSMTLDDWKAFLKEGETVVWSGSGSARYMWPMIALGLAFFGSLGIWFGHTALFYDNIDQFCLDDRSYTCARFFLFRWPGTIICGGSVLLPVLAEIALAFGWFRQDFALTERRALWIVRTPWNKALGKLYESDLTTENASLENGHVKFGSSHNGVRFYGLSPRKRDIILSLSYKLARAHQP